MSPNATQIAGQLRTALAAGGPIAAIILAKTNVSAGDYMLYLEAFLAIAPPLIAAAWSWWAKRPAALVKAASTVPGATVVTDESASPAVKAVAESPHATDVVTEKEFLASKVGDAGVNGEPNYKALS